MKRLLAIAALLALPAWAGQNLPATQTRETPWVGDMNFPDFYWEAAYRSSWGCITGRTRPPTNTTSLPPTTFPATPRKTG